MKKKIGLSLASLLIIMIGSFALTTTATWHGLPDVQSDPYIVTWGETLSTVVLHMGPLQIGPLITPFATRGPQLTPQTIFNDINFSMPLDPDGPGPLPTCIVFLTVPWQSIQSLEHIYFSGTLGYARVKLLPMPGSDGMGWLYIVPGIADVDIHTNNTFMPSPMPPPYNVTNPPEIPISIWTSPSPTPGAPAAIPTQLMYPFPDPGVDKLPGFAPAGPGTNDDGFGDGVPDPAGSSVLFLPLQLSVESWNGTDWTFKFGGPFVMPFTTGTCSDSVWPLTGLKLDGYSIAYAGAPWEDVATTGMWGANANKKFVTYAFAWSFLLYYLSDGPPIVKLDLIYGGVQKFVKAPHVIADINCDNVVDILDIVIGGNSFGARDEGSPAPPGYDPTGHGAPGNKWPGPYPPYMPSPWCVQALPNLNGNPFDARADLDNNGIINILDLCKIAIEFGSELDP